MCLNTQIVLIITAVLLDLINCQQQPIVQNLFNQISQNIPENYYDFLLAKCPEVKQFCGGEPRGDFDKELFVIKCLQGDPSKVAGLSLNCQYVVSKYVDYVYDPKRLQRKSRDHECNNIDLDDCFKHDGNVLECVFSKGTNTRDKCRNFISSLEGVWRNIGIIQTIFITDCSIDIEKYHCATEDSKAVTILECLNSNKKLLSPSCVNRVDLLISSKYSSDQETVKLYSACEKEADTFCKSKTEKSELFGCLITHRGDTPYATKCIQELTRQYNLLNIKNTRVLARVCKDDIRTYKCRKGASDNKDIRWAQILLCLEGAIRNRSAVDQECREELINHRKMLMRDYKLSPEIVTSCSQDIIDFCNHMSAGGHTIHCLMEHARPNRKRTVSAQCKRALEDLIKETDVAEDWRVDPVLHEACNSVVDVACKGIASGGARVMTCLVDKIGSAYMTDQCEIALMQIQYFVARDFKLDPQLYENCRADAVKFCHASPGWEDFGERIEPDTAPMVLPCLYRYYDHPNKTMQLKPDCSSEIKRVMHQRAQSVDLQPEVEDQCLDDLANYCYDKIRPGEETLCLQNHLDDLKPDCKKAVSELTERQSKNINLNPFINKNCGEAMQLFCSNELNTNKVDGDIMECLISHKNHPKMREDTNCRAAVEHFQLIELKDYHFTYKFKEACKPFVVNYCPKARTKADVIECLSERVLNDTILGTWNTIKKECRQQIRAQLFQQRESIDLDPKLEGYCGGDVKNFCSKVEHGGGRILECLKAHSDKLSTGCHRAIFRIKKKEMIDNGIDYSLMTACTNMIKQYCSNIETSSALECLKSHKDDHNFDSTCKHIVIERMIDQNRDYRLNPVLQKACQHDIALYCREVIAQSLGEKELNGKMIKCLKNKFREAKLKPKCEIQMTNILREQALNYNLNPLLRTVCAAEIETLCKPSSDVDDNTGAVEECLKNALLHKHIVNGECKQEVAAMIEESRADIHVDPLLQRACSLDIMKYCRDVPQGNGRHLKCLKIASSNPETPLTDECKEKLLTRMQMFDTADNVLPPESLRDIYDQVTLSPSRSYFVIVACTIIGFIFVSGLFCGRITRRAIAHKNK